MNANDTFEAASVRLFQGLAARFAAGGGGDAAPVASRRPPRLWELDHKQLCPVVGTCLDIGEVFKLARKHGVIPEKATEYEAHVTVVGYCKSRNALSQDVQRALDRKHALWLTRFAKARTAEAAGRLWQEALHQGEAAGALWGLLTCRAATEGLRQTAYEDIHMLSHQVGAGVRVELKRTVALEERVRELTAELVRANRRVAQGIAEGDLMVRHLERQLAEARAQAGDAGRLRSELEALASGQRLAELEGRLGEAVERATRLEREVERARAMQDQVAALTAENRRLAEAAAQAEAERDALERFFMDGNGCAGCPGEASCAGPGFAGRRLLCVGGRINLAAQYRALVERAGASLEFHDGGREEALSRLPDLLARADAVICPVDCVGHAAYYQLKRHCKLAGKPCVLARGSGLAGFAAALSRLAEGRADIRPRSTEEV